ncbi:glucose-1-phosphate cytidylyltransferase [Patescibacteria group bacterium]|nr:glucose-1-phosphate cytidylyltransferase [Patescibacteria group bacterium]
MKVVILCGGEGTRLREETEKKPKPLLPINGHPILWHIMKIYSHYGFNEFVLCLGYKGYMIKDFFLNYETMTKDFTLQLADTSKIEFHEKSREGDWKITFAETGRHALTGARLRKIRKYVGDTFMLTYGDGVADINIKTLLEFHKSHDRIATVTGVHPPSRFGEMRVENDQVLTFAEKPQISTGFINGGFLVLNQEIFDYLPDGDDLSLEGGPMASLAKDGQLRVYHHEGFWQPMDTYREFLILNKAWESGQAPWKVWD